MRKSSAGFCLVILFIITALPSVSHATLVLSPSDFQFMGYIKTPNAVGTFGAAGITVKKQNGQTTLLMTGGPGPSDDDVIEMNIPAPNLNFNSAPRAMVIRNWGDVYQGHKLDYLGNNAEHGAYFWNQAIHWVGDDSLYWTYNHMYNVDYKDHPSIGLTTFSGTTDQAFGPWKTVLGEHKTSGPMVDIPQSYANQYLSGYTMALGIQTMSGNAGSNWGTNLYAIPIPTATTPAITPALSAIPLLEHPFANRQTREPNYINNNGFPDISPVNGVGYWTQKDKFTGIVWIDLPDKHGILFIGSLATDHEWYGTEEDVVNGYNAQCPCGTGPVAEGYTPRWWLYDPSTFAPVVGGNTWDSQPIAVFDPNDIAQIKTNLVGGAYGHAAFDPDTRTLYVEGQAVDQAGDYTTLPVIYVYQIKNGAQPSAPSVAGNIVLSINYQGITRDAVGDVGYSPDGTNDSVFAVTLSGESKTITSIKFDEYSNTWHTDPARGFTPLGVSQTPGSALINSANLNLAVSSGSTFYLYASRNGQTYFNPDAPIYVNIKFSDNTYKTLYFTIPIPSYQPVANPDYQASRDYSTDGQGQHQWSYLRSDGVALTQTFGHDRWVTFDQYGPTITPYSMYPGDGYDLIRRWTAPATGNIRIAGITYDMNSKGGDGVIVYVKKNNDTIWTQAMANADIAGHVYDWIMTVNAVDTVDFGVNDGGRGDATYDTTYFNPEISYTNSAPTSPPPSNGVLPTSPPSTPSPSPTPAPTPSPVPIPIPSLTPVATDNFNRTNSSTLGTNWISDTNIGISSNEAGRGSGGLAIEYWKVNNFNADQYAQTTLAGADRGGPVVRMSGSGVNKSGYFFSYSLYGGYQISRMDAGTSTSLRAISITPHVGDQMTLTVYGTILTAYVNGVSVGSVTDSTYSAGAPGIGMFNDQANLPSLDDWEGGNLASGISGIIIRGHVTKSTGACSGCTINITIQGTSGAATTAGDGSFTLVLSSLPARSYTADIAITDGTTVKNFKKRITIS